MSFANLKRNNGNLEKLTKALEKMSDAGGKDTEENYWKPEIDKSGNGMATFRFLPTVDEDGENDPWVKMYSHGFQGPGGWLIDNCLTTKGEKCPVCESNTLLWNSGVAADKKIASLRKRRLSHVSNIYMIDDIKHPENNGKVFLFRYGIKIFEKIKGAAKPEFSDEKSFSPFDVDTGANFKLKVRKVEGFQNYDKSEFESVGPLFDDMSKMANLSGYSLQAILDDKVFKTFDEIQSRLNKVLGIGGTVRTTMEQAKMAPKTVVDEETNEDYDMSYFESLVDD